MIPIEGDFNEQLKKIQDLLNNYDGEVDYNTLLNEVGINIKELEDEMLNHKQTMELSFFKLNPDAVTPFYNYPSDSGFDLYSIEEVVIPPLGRALIGTGLSFDIKEGSELQIRSKSGLAINEGLFVLNSPGTADSGYIGEIKVILFNTNQTEYTVKKGMKIAQAVVSPVVNGGWIEFNQSNTKFNKDRGENGFGSTGI